MIGVIADAADREVVSEFFELFKTPWEFYRSDRRYEVVVCAGEDEVVADAKLTIRYSSKQTSGDGLQSTSSKENKSRFLLYKGVQIPIYGDCSVFPHADGILTEEGSGKTVAYSEQTAQNKFARIGYDLFAEVRSLLTVGQPTENASFPSLELHIAVLRDLIIACGIPLVEVPPVPEGHDLIACLTHDVDHPLLRAHKWDHTAFGFLYRASVGASLDLIKGRIGFGDLLTNWAAALKLPFVYLGLAQDFWNTFDDNYLELEKGLNSTFFVIPFKGHPGKKQDGLAPEFRASGYGAAEIADAVRKLSAAGDEIGLHGLDAWIDDSLGRKEFAEVRQLTGNALIGVRMHWLYFDQQSPVVLEKAGADYDSTVGYNDTIGYRAGTSQAYKPFGVTQLLELPLHIMDTALLYPIYLALSPEQVKTFVSKFVDNAAGFGGCLTINWHDRSPAPERLWGGLYCWLLQYLRDKKAWFSTASQAVCWFRKRRSVIFEISPDAPNGVRTRIAGNHPPNCPVCACEFMVGNQKTPKVMLTCLWRISQHRSPAR